MFIAIPGLIEGGRRLGLRDELINQRVKLGLRACPRIRIEPSGVRGSGDSSIFLIQPQPGISHEGNSEPGSPGGIPNDIRTILGLVATEQARLDSVALETLLENVEDVVHRNALILLNADERDRLRILTELVDLGRGASGG